MFFPRGPGVWCSDCYNERFAERCAVCQEAIVGAYFKHEGKKVHDACYRRNLAELCDVCGGALVGRILSDGWGYRYHEAHRSQFPPCDACSRLTCAEIGQGAVRLSDGRHLCRLCEASAVRGEAAALVRFEGVRRFLAQRGMLISDAAVPLSLVSRHALREILARSGHPPSKSVHGCTLAEQRIENARVVRTATVVYLLGSLPTALFDGIAAHELGHVWAFHSGCPRHAHALGEGFCNYLRYLVHRAGGGLDNEFYARQMMADDNPSYGQGFRIVKRLAERKGFPALLDHMRKKADFPLLGW